MKRLTLLFALVLSGFVTFLAPNTLFADAQNLNGVVAIVNSSVVTQNEFNSALAAAKQQMGGGNPNAIDNSKLRKMVMQQLVDEKLQLELATRANIKVTDKQVTDAISHIATGNHMTLTQLQQALQQRGMSYADYKKMIHKQLLVHQVQQSAVANQVHVTDQDLADARAQVQAQSSGQQAYHVIDIVMPQKADAQKIMVALKNGEDLSKIAPNAKDMGWQNSNALPTLFLTQLKNMQPGDVAGPIQAPNGFHVLKLVAVRGQSPAALSKQQLQNIAYQIQFQKAVEKWMTEVRKTAYVKIISP